MSNSCCSHPLPVPNISSLGGLTSGELMFGAGKGWEQHEIEIDMERMGARDGNTMRLRLTFGELMFGPLPGPPRRPTASQTRRRGPPPKSSQQGAA
eukprot:8748518-Pyramimonas_sp.AAC.1